MIRKLLAGAAVTTAVVGGAATTASATEYRPEDGDFTLVQGESGYRVQQMQTLIEWKGCEVGPLDGKFGPMTAAGLKCAEARADVFRDAVFDPWTFLAVEALNNQAIPVRRPVAPTKRTTPRGTTQSAPRGTGSVSVGSGPRAVLAAGRCDWLAPHLAAAGLPVSTFMAISARESGCAPGGVHVNDRDDLSTSRFGLNFKGNMPAYWRQLCGVSDYRAPGASVSVDVACTAAAYRRSGLGPWAVR